LCFRDFSVLKEHANEDEDCNNFGNMFIHNEYLSLFFYDMYIVIDIEKYNFGVSVNFSYTNPII